jgi:peptidoglycan/xylan/chitin deacetylase (PgdA/CDA1 family)
MPKIKLIYTLLKFSGILWLFNRLMIRNEQRVILCYHRISEKKFEQHIRFLKEKFDIVPLHSLLSATFSTHKTPQLHSTKALLALTMDDCYGKEFHQAFTVCQKHQAHCTYFVPTYYAEKQVSLWSLRLIDMLRKLELPSTITDFECVQVTFNHEQDKRAFELKWISKFLNNKQQTSEIEALFDKFFTVNNFKDQADAVIGNEIIVLNSDNKFTSLQSHTVSHPKLYLCSPTQLKHEFEDSKLYLSKLALNENQYVICYPYGSSVHIGDSFKEASNFYEYGVTFQSGVVNRYSDRMLVPRIGIYEHDTYQSICVKVIFAQLQAILK